MACYGNRSTCNPIIVGSDDWGCLPEGKGICDKCFGSLKIYFPNEDLPADKYANDYKRILLLLQTKDRVLACMKQLSKELGQEQRAFPRHRDRSIHTKDGYIKLSRFLEKYETLCWFPPCHLVFTGFVPPDNFPKYLARGLIAKDPGAGPQHGDFTHRLQWHAIARVITKDFSVPIRKGWDNSPLELLTSLGSTTEAKFWLPLFEQGDGFCFPDRLHEELRKPTYGELARQVGLRWNKRVTQYEAADKELVKKEVLSFDDYFRKPTAAELKKKTQARYFEATQLGVDKNVKNKTHYAEDGHVPGDPAKWNTKSAFEGDADIDIKTRIQNSRARLNADTGAYAKNLGILHQGKRVLDLKQFFHE